jgi:hypothetical protein
MAKKQSRRCVSLNRSAYEAAKLEADRRGMTLAALVESGLTAIGVTVVAHPQQTIEMAQANAAWRAGRRVSDSCSEIVLRTLVGSRNAV